MSSRTTLTPDQANRRRNLNKKILTFGCLPITVILILVIVAAIAGSNDTDSKDTSVPRDDAPSLSTADRNKAREAAGLPPEPAPEARKAFLAALNKIDPRIIKPGKDDQAVSRGLNQCSSIKTSPDDRDKLVQQALERFTVTTRLPEIATPETGGKILDAVHKHICPDF